MKFWFLYFNTHRFVLSFCEGIFTYSWVLCFLWHILLLMHSGTSCDHVLYQDIIKRLLWAVICPRTCAPWCIFHKSSTFFVTYFRASNFYYCNTIVRYDVTRNCLICLRCTFMFSSLAIFFILKLMNAQSYGKSCFSRNV